MVPDEKAFFLQKLDLGRNTELYNTVTQIYYLVLFFCGQRRKCKKALFHVAYNAYIFFKPPIVAIRIFLFLRTWSWPSGWCIGLRSWLRGFDAQLGHLHDACTLLLQKP